MIELEKMPVPVPSLVQLSTKEGLGEVLQQTPFAIIADSPSEVISPPPVAVVALIFEIAAVVTVGKTAIT